MVEDVVIGAAVVGPAVEVVVGGGVLPGPNVVTGAGVVVPELISSQFQSDQVHPTMMAVMHVN